MPDSHYIGSPEDSGEWPVLREPRETKPALLWKRALWFAVMYAVIAGAVLLVAMLAGCTYSGPWRATFSIRYANGKEITSGHAGSIDSGAHEGDSSFESKAARGNGASPANVERPRGDKR